MECCSICLGPLEEQNLCKDCVRSKQEKYKEEIREKQTVLRLLTHERKSLKKRVEAHIESNQEQYKQNAEGGLAAANLRAIRDTTLKFAEDAVKTEEQEIERLRENLAQRREALAKGRALVAIMQKRVEEERQKIHTSAGSPVLVPNKSTADTTTTSSRHNPRTHTTTSTTTSTKNIPATSIDPKNSTTSPRKASSTPSTQPSSSHSTHSSTHTSSRPHTTHISSHPSSSRSPAHSSSSQSSHSTHSSTKHASTPSSHHTSHHHTSTKVLAHKSQAPAPSVPPPFYTFADLQNFRQQLAQKRRALVSELLSFFPINPSPTASETETIILNVTMPNNGVYTYYRPDALSAALGYVAHVVYIIACYLGVTLPWKIEFAGAQSSIWDPFNGKRHPLHGTRYDEIEPGLTFLNRAVVYLCGSQGVHVPISAKNCTLPNLLALLRSPTLGLSGPLEALRPEPAVKVSRPPLRVTEPPPSPVLLKIVQEDDDDDESDFIVVENSTIPTPEQTEELEQFERAMFIDTV